MSIELAGGGERSPHRTYPVIGSCGLIEHFVNSDPSTLRSLTSDMVANERAALGLMQARAEERRRTKRASEKDMGVRRKDDQSS